MSTKGMRVAEPTVTVVIPTRGTAARAAHLLRAIESVRAQREVQAVALVVLNGAQRAPEVERALRSEPGVRVLVRDDADLPSAHRLGREAVDTPWFGTLDDDDLLLPNALARRLHALIERPAADVVVTNGIIRANGRDARHIARDLDVAADPLRALTRRTWLLPGSWLARSERVGASLFDGMPRHLECTFLALRFSTAYAMHWLPEPTVIYNRGSPGAESESRAYVLEQPLSVEALLRLPLPPWMCVHLERELAGAHHCSAELLWLEGDLKGAWRMHRRSLRGRGGLRFLPFTRHLLASAWQRALAHARRSVA
jgi:hypothetical protein